MVFSIKEMQYAHITAILDVAEDKYLSRITRLN